jgi:hypothetical protein
MADDVCGNTPETDNYEFGSICAMDVVHGTDFQKPLTEIL